MNKHTTNLTMNETEAMHYGYEYPHTHDEPVTDDELLEEEYFAIVNNCEPVWYESPVYHLAAF